MSDMDEILSQIPMDQLAAMLGVDEQTAADATQEALPALLGGLQANAADPSGADSLLNALGGHGGLLDGGLDLGGVDTSDGQQIVANIFGDNSDAVMSQLGGYGALGSRGGSSLVAKLLPILAPIVMAWLSKKLQGSLGGAMGGGSSSSTTADDGGVLGSGRGSTPTGSAAQPQDQTADSGLGGAGDILGSILGGVLGGATGGSSQSSAGGAGSAGSIIDILGGLLGGGRR
jgi:hypothetical protein